MNRIVEETMRHYVNDRQTDWDLLLAAVEFAINNTWQASIQTTPFHLNYGYHPTLPVDIVLPQQTVADAFAQERQDLIRQGGKYFRFAQQRFNEDRLQSLVATAKQMLTSARECQKNHADAKRIVIEFQP